MLSVKTPGKVIRLAGAADSLASKAAELSGNPPFRL